MKPRLAQLAGTFICGPYCGAAAAGAMNGGGWRGAAWGVFRAASPIIAGFAEAGASNPKAGLKLAFANLVGGADSGNIFLDVAIQSAGGCARGSATGAGCRAGARTAVTAQFVAGGIDASLSVAVAYISRSSPAAGPSLAIGEEPSGISDEIHKNPNFSNSVFRYESGDQRWIIIEVALKPADSHVESTQYANNIASALSGQVDGGDRLVYNVITLAVLSTQGGHNVSLSPCNPGVCPPDAGGAANLGAQNIYNRADQLHSSALSGHEFMHILGFHHQANATFSIRSYSLASSRSLYYWTLTTKDVNAIWDKYK